MKIKDIISEQGVWQGVKNVGKGLGQIAGGVGMGALRGLDKLGGGTGQVGTAAQQAAYTAANKAKRAMGVAKAMPQQALAAFQTELKGMGIDLNDARTFNPDQVERMLENFAAQFYSAGEPEGIANYIMHHSNSVPLPTVLNNKTALEYLTRMGQIKKDAQGIVQQTGKAATPLHAASTTPVKGISLINDYPAIIKYNNVNYSLNDSGEWEDDKGTIPKRQWQMFLYKQADLLVPGSEELNKGFDKLMSPKPEPTPEPTKAPKPLQVKVGNELITKSDEDGRWYDESGDFIGNPSDIERLEQMAASQKWTRSASTPQSKMPSTMWKTRKEEERAAARQARPGNLGA